MLYHPVGIFKSLPTLFVDRGKARSAVPLTLAEAVAAWPPGPAAR
jgi:hypothetical protein